MLEREKYAVWGCSISDEYLGRRDEDVDAWADLQPERRKSKLGEGLYFKKSKLIFLCVTVRWKKSEEN